MGGRTVHKTLIWIAAGILATALTGMLAGCELPPICGAQFGKSADECVALNASPTVRIGVGHTTTTGLRPLPKVGDTIIFYAYVHDVNGDNLHVAWDLNADGVFEARDDEYTVRGREEYHAVRRIYRTPGTRRAAIRVTDYPGLPGGEGVVAASISVRVYSLDELTANNFPEAQFTFSVSGRTVRVDGSASSDLDGDRITRYSWDFDGDDVVDHSSSEPVTSWTYESLGTYVIRLTVFDEHGFPSFARRYEVTLDGSCTPPSCGRAEGSAAAPAGLPFSARLDGKTLRLRMLSHPGKLSWAERTLRGFLKAALRPRLKTMGTTSSGLALATGRKRARACLRVTYRIEPGKVPTGTLQVLGGTKAASRLRAKATFRFAGGPRGSALGLGIVKASRGKARPLPRACAKLARVLQG
jgi:hypothetical protein